MLLTLLYKIQKVQKSHLFTEKKRNNLLQSVPFIRNNELSSNIMNRPANFSDRVIHQSQNE